MARWHESCEWTSEERACVGATYAQQAAFMGRKIETHFRVTQYEAGHKVSIESTQSTFPIQVTRKVEALDDGSCRVTAHVRGQPRGLMSLFSPMVRMSIRKDYAKLKAMLEAGP